MGALTQGDFLALWESGRTLHPLDRGVLAVHAAFPETRRESVADWPLGRRNRALAQMRCLHFGTRLRGWTACRQCGDKLEFEMDGRALAEQAAPEPSKPGNQDGQDEQIVVSGQVFRLPTSRDLALIAGERDSRAAAIRLLKHCRVGDSTIPDSRSDLDEPQSLEAWTEDELDAVGERMAEADPLAEILLSFECPACGDTCQEPLDLAAFLWEEIEGRAKRLLLDIHALASAYGWSEAEVLSLSEARRQCYLEMVQA
jgi:hypothetical protein